MLLAPLTLAVENGIARLTLDRPDLGNVLSSETIVALGAAVREVASRTDVRVVVLAANGPMFCAGGDIREFVQVGDGIAQLIGDELINFNQTLLELAGLPVPVVSSLHGAVAGGGIGLALTADVVIAADTVRFRAGYAGIGLGPDAGTSFQLTRLVGPMRAKEFLFTNRFIDAAEALAIGLVARVVPEADLASETTELAERIASFPKSAHAAAKELAGTSIDSSHADVLALEREWMIRNSATTDCREGIRAFTERRRPEFSR